MDGDGVPDMGQFVQQQLAYIRQVQQLMQQPNLHNNDHILQMQQQMQQLHQIQQIPAVPLPQAQQVPIPQPPPPPPLPQLQPLPLQQLQPQQAAHAPPANLGAPQVHVHMLPAGLGYAAIPYYAQFAAGQYAPPLRRRLALPRRAAAAALGVQPAAGVAPAAPQQQAAQPLFAVDLNEWAVEWAPVADQRGDMPEIAGVAMDGADAAAAAAAAVAVDHQPPPAPDPIHPEQPREIQVQLVVVPPPHDPQAGENVQPAVDRVDDPMMMLDDPLGVDGLFDEDLIFNHFRADVPDDAADRPAAAAVAGGERTPPRDIPARIEDADQQETHATCPICVLPFKNGSDGSRVARVLACGHLICTGCVNQFCRNLRENRLAYRSYDRAPCIVCQRAVRWRNLPECKTVGYLYEQLELMNEERKPMDGASKIRTDARKKAYRHLDNVSSSCHEIATKMRKLVRKADGVYDQSLEMSSHSVDRETMNRVESEEQAAWLVGKVEEEASRVSVLEKQFNEHYDKMHKILEEISSNTFTLPKEFPNIQGPSTSN